MISELLAVLFLAVGGAKLALLLGMQIAGDFREAARQASIKRLNTDKRRYLPSVSAVVYTQDSMVNIVEILEDLRTSSYKLQEIIVIAEPKSAITKAVNHYRRVEKLTKFVSVRHHAIGNSFKILGAKPRGQLLLLLDGTTLPTAVTVGAGIIPFRDKTVATVMPYSVPVITSALASGLRATRHVVSLHFRRSRAPQSSDLYGALLIRTPTLNRIVKKHPEASTLRDVMAIVQEFGNQARLVRQTEATVRVPAVRWAPHLSFGGLMWWAIDVLAIWGVLYYYGRYEGVALLAFASLFAWFLAIIAVVVAKGLRISDKINLILLAPFTYVIIQLLAPIWWVAAYMQSKRNKTNKPPQNKS